MTTVCPSCKTSIGFSIPSRAEGLKLRCSGCGSIFKLVRKPVTCQSGQYPDPGRRVKVVVASEQQELRSRIINVLADDRFEVVSCNEGNRALAAIERMKPDIAVINVFLPGMYGFEVCEAVRRQPDLASVKLILLEEVRENRKYTRTPTSLYGADAFLETIMIEDRLEDLVRQFLPSQPSSTAVAAGAGIDKPLSPCQGAVPVYDGLGADDASPPVTEEHQKAIRLARLIVSDIALYNRHLVDEGVRDGTFFDLLRDDIREGRALFDRRIAEEIRCTTSYLDDAFSELIARKRQELS